MVTVAVMLVLHLLTSDLDGSDLFWLDLTKHGRRAQRRRVAAVALKGP